MYKKVGDFIDKNIIEESKETDDDLPEVNELAKLKYKIDENEFQELEFKIGSEEKFEIIEQLVQTMYLDEISIFKIKKQIFLNDIDFLYNTKDFEITIQLLDYWKDEEIVLDFPLEQRLEKCWEYKKKGKLHYEEANLDEALLNFNKALEFIDWLNSKEFLEEKINLLNNISLIYLKQENYLESINYSNYLLKIDKNNIKALYKKAKSLYKLNKEDESLEILNYAMKIDNNDSITNLFNEINNNIKKQEGWLKKGLNKAFN